MKFKLVLLMATVIYAQISIASAQNTEHHSDDVLKAVHEAQVAKVKAGTHAPASVPEEPAHTVTTKTLSSSSEAMKTPTVTTHHAESKHVEPAVAFGWLKNGNTRFKKGKVRNDGQSQKDITKLSSGQNPHSIVLSCSDSRVPPEVVFDQKLGEIFTVRTAGQALDDNAVGSIEYAVEHLGTRLIVVMGHTHCGAVKAALGTLDGKDAGTPALNGLVKDIHPRLQNFKGKKPSHDVELESWANVDGVTKDLLTRSELLRKKFAAGEIEFKTALYHLNTGNVNFHDKVEVRVPAAKTETHDEH